ncbi:hypothetical protein MOA67_gp029 [Klebsiella phage KpLz-2_45]|uniref:hypothetical protein n=1 Tax=Klebsiella phage KpLz-2_45 TaxID=2698923 RepID=UPI001F13A038|nr:hypothetical protein MOA67_gp029 [Klebsiella phage KpLz-2_45]UKS71895.1 hypothetical protein KpLz245_0290 [Klebsiella phage KpLz-2_45]
MVKENAMEFKLNTPLSRSLKDIYDLDLPWLRTDLYLQALERTAYSLFDVNDITKANYVDPWSSAKVYRIPDSNNQGIMRKNNFSIHIPLKLPKVPPSRLVGLRLVIKVEGYSSYVDCRSIEMQFFKDGPWEELKGKYNLKQLKALISTYSTDMLQ